MTTEEMKVYDETVAVHAGYTRNQLKAAFERVQDQNNWKMPTRSITVDTLEEARMINAAIGFFTGGSAMYYSIPKIHLRGEVAEMLWVVPATEGYYFHIGA